MLEEAVARRFGRRGQARALHARGQLLEPSQQPAPDPLPAQITGNVERFYAQSITLHMPCNVADDRSGELSHQGNRSCQVCWLAGRINLKESPEGGLVLRFDRADEQVLAFQSISLSGCLVTIYDGFPKGSNRIDS